MKDDKSRCAWVGNESIYRAYHDLEWGVPLHNDRKLFEFLILEGAQAGLSWITILKKRQNYKKAFDSFDAKKIAWYDEKKFKALLTDSGIIRNKLKIRATIQNAKAYLTVVNEFGSFDKYIWSFVSGSPLKNTWQNSGTYPTKSNESEAMSRDLIKRDFKFVGPTICYAFMQAVGMINDHEPQCFRDSEI